MGIEFLFEDASEREQVERVVEKLMSDSLGPMLYEKMLGHRRRA
jgi:hypothetical protein